MTTLAAVNIEFGFTVATWLIGSFLSALIGAFAYGKIQGIRQKGIDARFDEERAARKGALELESRARTAELNLEAAARKTALDAETEARLTALDREAAARKAALDTEAVARTTALANETEGRRRLHIEIDEVKGRLKEGDSRFTDGVKTLAELTTRMESTTSRIEAVSSLQGQFMRREECARLHAELEKRIDAAGKPRH